MLRTYYDYKIYRDFQLSRPENEMRKDFDKWYEYLKFLKSGTDLIITNYSESKSDNLINSLITGRGDGKLEIRPKFSGFHGNIVPSAYRHDDLFFLDEEDSLRQKGYRSKNSHYFGFVTDHFESFGRLTKAGHGTVIPVRRKPSLNKFTSWDILNGYLLPFSDCIIIDNFLFSKIEKKLDENVSKLLRVLDHATPVRYNLLIITYYGDKGDVKLPYVTGYLKRLTIKQSLKCNISVIVSNKIEHDRNIFMNYLRIRSGTSLNYFDEVGKTEVRTEMEILPYADRQKFEDSRVILKDVSQDVSKIIDKSDPGEVSGDCKNRLLISE